MPTLLKPGWMRITGNFSKARKKNIPEPNAMRSKRDDWLHGGNVTARPMRSCAGVWVGCTRSASSVQRPKNGVFGTASHSSSLQVFSLKPKYYFLIKKHYKPKSIPMHFWQAYHSSCLTVVWPELMGMFVALLMIPLPALSMPVSILSYVGLDLSWISIYSTRFCCRLTNLLIQYRTR